MCFAPEGRALFRHLNFQKCSERDVFLVFSLAKVLRATTACTFFTSQLPKVVRELCVLCIMTWKCASCHNSVQLFISHLATWLRTRRFSEPGATNHWKNTIFRDFPTFSRTCIFFLLIFSLLLFSSLTLPISAFPSAHIVWSLTSKLPSIIYKYTLNWFCYILFKQKQHSQPAPLPMLSPLVWWNVHGDLESCRRWSFPADKWHTVKRFDMKSAIFKFQIKRFRDVLKVDVWYSNSGKLVP